MFDGPAYLDRAAPRFAPAKFLAWVFVFGPFIEPDPGSNFPGRIFGAGRLASAFRFLVFCAAFAFARRRAFALVMSASPFLMKADGFRVCFVNPLIAKSGYLASFLWSSWSNKMI